jgi:hypothetical protein
MVVVMWAITGRTKLISVCRRRNWNPVSNQTEPKAVSSNHMFTLLFLFIALEALNEGSQTEKNYILLLFQNL